MKLFTKYSHDKKPKLLIVFENLIIDVLSNKKLNPNVTNLFIRGRKLNFLFLSHNFILQYQKV